MKCLIAVLLLFMASNVSAIIPDAKIGAERRLEILTKRYEPLAKKFDVLIVELSAKPTTERKAWLNERLDNISQLLAKILDEKLKILETLNPEAKPESEPTTKPDITPPPETTEQAAPMSELQKTIIAAKERLKAATTAENSDIVVVENPESLLLFPGKNYRVKYFRVKGLGRVGPVSQIVTRQGFMDLKERMEEKKPDSHGYVISNLVISPAD